MTDYQAENQTEISQHKSVFGNIRRWFLAGLLLSAPVFLTTYITWIAIDLIDKQVVNLLPKELIRFITSWVPGFGIFPGYGIIIGFVSITLLGALTTGFLGRWIVHLGERVLNSMPVVRTIYGSSKQILETVVATQSDAFRDAVILEYPRKGTYVIGFVTGVAKGEIDEKIDTEIVNVFVPTTPNPTSGFLLLCPKAELTYLDMAVEDAIKLVVSAGIVTPEKSAKKTKKNVSSQKEA
ncbi:MAG: DUF502 domain-containing protein [Alphaproteobacteria bacterium]|nr:DUF502 domain-containing protein [Alphaproteobacteria bacterium]